MRLSPIRCSGNFREERPDIGVEYEIHLLAADADDQRVQRIVLAALRSEAMREPEEIFLVDRAQHLCRRPLDDLVFQRGDRERASAAVFLRNISPTRRRRPIRSSFDPRVQVLDLAIDVPFVGLPCHAVHAGRGVTLDRVKRRSQKGGVDMVEERSEPLLLPSPCGLPYAFPHAFPVLRPARASLIRVPLGPSAAFAEPMKARSGQGGRREAPPPASRARRRGVRAGLRREASYTVALARTLLRCPCCQALPARPPMRPHYRGSS